LSSLYSTWQSRSTNHADPPPPTMRLLDAAAASGPARGLTQVGRPAGKEQAINTKHAIKQATCNSRETLGYKLTSRVAWTLLDPASNVKVLPLHFTVHAHFAVERVVPRV